MPPHRNTSRAHGRNSRAIQLPSRKPGPTARARLVPCRGRCNDTCVISRPSPLNMGLDPALDQVLAAFERIVEARTAAGAAAAAVQLRAAFDGLVRVAERCFQLTHNLYFARLADRWEKIVAATFDTTAPGEHRGVGGEASHVWQQLTASPPPTPRRRPPRPRRETAA